MPLSCNDYFCASDESCIKKPIQSQGLSPFVRMSFPPMNLRRNSAEGRVSGTAGPTITTIDDSRKPDITVGNQSNPPRNHAAIKSFSYGASDGNGAEVEVFDEEGGEFDLFVNKMVKVLPDANDFGCSIEWGWIVTKCDGTSCVIRSSTHYFLIISISINYAHGGISFKLELQDLMEPLFETRSTGDIQDVTLKEAIRQVFKEATPSIESVLFISARAASRAGGLSPCNGLVGIDSGNLTAAVGNCGMGRQRPGLDLSSLDNENDTFVFEADSVGGRDGRNNKAKSWACNGLTPLAAVREWLQREKTTNGKGTIIFWNSVSRIPQLVIMEDPLPKCWSDLDSEQCSRSIGTYIVNGGKDSPVISFNPQIKFVFSAAAKAGAVVDSEGADADKTTSTNPCPEEVKNPKGTGTTIYGTMPATWNQRYGSGRGEALGRGIAANEKANKLYENIEAELTIQGDPNLDNPYVIKIKTISLVVINPFHLMNNNDNQPINGCPAWLIGPPCNQILSNKNWFIKGVSHEIKGGSYTTTLKLYLPAPGRTTSI